MKGKRSKRSNVSEKNKKGNLNENHSQESEENGDNTEKNEFEEKVQKKQMKKDQRHSNRNRKGVKKIMAESSEEEDYESIKSNESNLPKRESGRRSVAAKAKTSLCSEDEINGEKGDTKRNQRRSSRKVVQKSMSCVLSDLQQSTDNENDDDGDGGDDDVDDNNDDDDDEEEFEKPLKSIKRGSKRKENFKEPEMKKAKVDNNEKNGESDVGQGDLENSSKNKKPDSKKQKKIDKDDQIEDEVSPEEYEVEKLVDIYFKKNGEREFLVRWKGYSSKNDTWEPEKHLNCKELIDAFLKKCEKAKSIPLREMRTDRRKTERYNVNAEIRGRKLSARFKHKPRKTYFDIE